MVLHTVLLTAVVAVQWPVSLGEGFAITGWPGSELVKARVLKDRGSVAAVRKLNVGGRDRSYRIYLPREYAPQRPTPVVLVFHGSGSDAESVSQFSGMNSQADKGGFIAVYPNGTRFRSTPHAWNSGGFNRHEAAECPDDVEFVRRLLDDLATTVNVDCKRVYATGHSSGAMMCYRLAVELPDRIAAIAPVGGTMAVDVAASQLPVSVIHFHGTLDTFVPWCGSSRGASRSLLFKSVERTVGIWAKVNGCPAEPLLVNMPNKAADGLTVERRSFGAGKGGAEVVLYAVVGGGHTWPGAASSGNGFGKSTLDISANDLMWEFFQKHPMK